MILANFLSPESISTTPISLLFALPLIAVIAIVYKATKIEQVKPWPFIKECVILFGSILVFIVVIGVVLYLAMRIIVG